MTAAELADLDRQHKERIATWVAHGKCHRCGDKEYRIDGYCSIYCRDMAGVEAENADLRDELAAVSES